MILPVSLGGLSAARAKDIITDALIEIGAYSAGEAVRPEDAMLALGRLNDLLDSWNARMECIYANNFATYPLSAGHQTRTIGPTGNYVVGVRPEAIQNASLVLAGSVKVPINLRDDDWWAHLTVPAVTGSVVTDLYYSADWPNGTLFFWPTPSAANSIELETLTLLNANLALGDLFSMPPGYKRAVTLTLAESIARPFGKEASGELRLDAAKARAVIEGANSHAPNISACDAGIPTKTRGARGNYLTGWLRG